MPSPTPKVEHLYVHVPFCVAKCRYCAFHSRPGTETEMETFVADIARDLKTNADILRPTTIFIGGGTPSILPLPLWERLLEAIGRARCPSAPQHHKRRTAGTAVPTSNRLQLRRGARRADSGARRHPRAAG